MARLLTSGIDNAIVAMELQARYDALLEEAAGLAKALKLALDWVACEWVQNGGSPCRLNPARAIEKWCTPCVRVRPVRDVLANLSEQIKERLKDG